MDAFFNGPLGQIAELALEKLCNSPRLSDREKIQEKYDVLEAHFQGVSRILKPAMQLLVECKSADRAKSESHSSSLATNYYTPQRQSTNCSCSQRYVQKDNFQNDRLRNNREFFSNTRDNSWKTCDACQAVSKFLIPTSCDHEICQKCVNSGKNCQKCLIAVKKIKREKF